MSTAALHVLAVLLLVVGAGILPACALVGRWQVAVAAAPLTAAVLCSGAAVVALVLGAPYPLSLTAMFVPAWAISLLALRRHPAAPGRDPLVGWAQVLVLASVLGGLLQAVRRAPIDWDTRAIWFVHSDWLWLGGARAAEALGRTDLKTFHADYPPLGPATVAAVWSVLGRDYEVAQLVLALLTASAALVAAVSIQVVLRMPRWLATVAGTAVLLAAYGLAGGYATNGYIDLLWAAAVVGGTVCLLLGGTDERCITGLGAVCLAAAMLTKNEGMVAGMAVAVLVVARRGRRGLALAVPPVALAAAWVLTSKSLGAEGDMIAGGGLSRLLRLDPDVRQRVGPTLEGLWSQCRWELLVAGALTAAGLLVARRRRRELAGAGAGWLWAVTLACLGAVGGAYLISPNDINWHLATSVERTTLAPRLLLLVESVVWLVALGSTLVAREVTRRPDPPLPPFRTLVTTGTPIEP